MDESKENLVKKVQRLELEKQQLVQLLHDTEETMALQFRKSQEETLHLKQLFSSVLPLLKAKAAPTHDQSTSTVLPQFISKSTQTVDSDPSYDPKILLNLASLEQKLNEIELCASDAKASAGLSEELTRLKQRERASEETATNCKKLADQLQVENEKCAGEILTLERENDMLRLYVLDSEGLDRPLPAVCKALYSRK